MHIAIEGCLHGELDKVYATLLYIQQEKKIKIDLLICCGDFQSLRNKEDMYAMSCPEKYLSMGNFYEYYTGKKKAPILTIFIGGNHEASNYLRELYFGGWVAENIYYLGSSNAIWVRKGNHQIRVGGISGIYKDYHYHKGYFEKMPLNDKAKKSAYHIREFEVYKLNFLTENVDVFLSHDWPIGIHRYGNVEGLLRIKPFFREEIQNNTLGNPALTYLLNKLTPKYWFAAHLHVKFTAEVKHEGKTHPTKFLALDKCLPKRNFLQVLNVSEEQKKMEEEVKESEQPADTSSQPVELFYDIEWLAIQKLTATKIPVSDTLTNLFQLVDGSKWVAEDFEENLKKINEYKKTLAAKNIDLKIPLNFEKTVEAYDPKKTQPFSVRDKLPLNNQTESYLKMLDIDTSIFENFLCYDHEKKQASFGVDPTKEVIKDVNDDEIDLGMDFGVSSTPQEVSKPTTEQVNKPAVSAADVNISLEDLPFK